MKETLDLQIENTDICLAVQLLSEMCVLPTLLQNQDENEQFAQTF